MSPNSWKIEYGGRTLVRWQGLVIYDGPTADMPERIKRLAETMTADSGKHLSVLLSPPASQSK